MLMQHAAADACNEDYTILSHAALRICLRCIIFYAICLLCSLLIHPCLHVLLLHSINCSSRLRHRLRLWSSRLRLSHRSRSGSTLDSHPVPRVVHHATQVPDGGYAVWLVVVGVIHRLDNDGALPVSICRGECQVRLHTSKVANHVLKTYSSPIEGCVQCVLSCVDMLYCTPVQTNTNTHNHIRCTVYNCTSYLHQQ